MPADRRGLCARLLALALVMLAPLASSLGVQAVAMPAALAVAAAFSLLLGLGLARGIVRAFDDLARRSLADQARLRMALATGRMAPWAWTDPDGAISWGEGGERVVGPLLVRAASRPEFMQCVHADDRERVAAVLDAFAAATPGDWRCQFRVGWPDGPPRWISLEGAAQAGSDGRGVVAGLARDITDDVEAGEALRRTEAALEESRASVERRVVERTAQLQAANAELESFSYTVAHDLRAPLRAIEGFSLMLEEEAGPALGTEARAYLERIRGNTAMMARMIEELLELSRIGRAELERSAVSLQALAREVCDSLAPAYPRAVLRVGTLPTVHADPTLMRMVMTNLVGNALKFSSKCPEPRVEVHGRIEAGEAIVTVSDNGVGFDPQYIGKMFGVFQRLHTRSEFEGTGVGLATVARIMCRHGGRVWAESEVGEGARFHFAVPCGRVDP